MKDQNGWVIAEEHPDGWVIGDTPAQPSAPAGDPSGGQTISAAHEGLWDRVKDNAYNAARETPLVNQAVTYLTGKLSGDSAQAVQDERDYRDKYSAQGQDDKWNRSGHETAGDFLSDASRGVASLAGNIVGGLPNPINYIAPGGPLTGRIAGQAGTNAVADVADQGLSMAQGVQDDYDWKRTALALGVGAVFGMAPVHGRATDLQSRFDAGATAEELLKDAPDLDPAKVNAMVLYRDKGGEGAKFVDEKPAEQTVAANDDKWNITDIPQESSVNTKAEGPVPEAANENTRKLEPNWLKDFGPAADTADSAKYRDLAKDQGVPDGTVPWFLDGEKPVYMSNGLEAAGPRAAELDQFPSISKGSTPEDAVTVWYKPGEEERAQRLLDLANVAGSTDTQKGIYHRVQGRLLGYDPDEVERYVAGRGYEANTSDPHLPVLANPTDIQPAESGGGAGGKEPPTDGPGIPEEDIPNGGGSGPEGEKGKYAANINLERLATDDELDDILRDAAQHLKLDTQTHGETIGKARQMLQDMSPSDIILHDPKLTEATEHALALRTTLVASTNKLRDAAERVLDPTTNSDDAIARMNLWRITTAAAAEKTSKVAGQAGRLLNQFNIIAGDDAKGLHSALHNLDEMVGQKINPREMAQALLIHAKDAAAQAKLAQDSFKPHFEDYVLTLWYNGLLSGPMTHARNVFGNAANFLADGAEHVGAAAIGAFRRGEDKVTAGELKSRMFGTWMALRDATTYKKTLQAFQEGHPVTNVNKSEMGESVFAGIKNDKLRKTIQAVETPTRLLSAEDEYWRNVITSSSLYGYGYRDGVKKGLKDQALSDHVKSIVNNPTKQILDRAIADSQRLQFVDKPSTLAEKIQGIKSHRPIGKSKTLSAAQRTIRFMAHVAIPFARVSDSIIRTVLRRSPLGVFDRYNLADFHAGGARRDLAVARVGMGSTVIGVLAAYAMNGDITGDGPKDYRKRAELQASGWQANSVKVGDRYYALSGLDPMASTSNIVASLTEKYKAGELTDEGYASAMLKSVGTTLRLLNNNSFTQDVGNLFNLIQDGPQGESAMKLEAGNIASSFTTPAILRQANQTFGDKGVKDLNGDNSPGDYVWNRMTKEYHPSSFPQKYDVYGNPIVKEGNLVGTTSTDRDPVVKELARLGGQGKTALVGPAPKTIKIDGFSMKLDSDQYENYQRVSGQNLVETLRGAMETKEWKGLSDVDKAIAVRAMTKAAREDARDALFNPANDQTGWSIK